MAMRIEGFVIHLARATQRRTQADRICRLLPMPSEVVEAVDGRALTAAEADAACRPGLHRPRYPFSLNAGEIGCFLSHRKLWKMIVERDLDAGLIIEDDVDIEGGDFARALSFVRENLGPRDYVRFPWRDDTDRGRVLAERDGLTLERPRHAGLGTLCQVVGREAAAELLAASEVFDRPADSFIQARWLHKANVLAVRPVTVRNMDASLGGTTLRARRSRSIADVIRREIGRPRYRLSVWLRDLVHPDTG